jgi:hypothetical protein
MLGNFRSVTHRTQSSKFVTFALLHAAKAIAGNHFLSTSMMVSRCLGLKESSSTMPAVDDRVISDVLRDVVQAEEGNWLGSKLAEVAPGITSS